YRVEWARTPEEYRAGRVGEVVVPWTLHRFHSHDAELMRLFDVRVVPLVHLGGKHADVYEGFRCNETLAWPKGPGGERVAIPVGIIPLFADGSEGPRPPEPTLVAPPPEPPSPESEARARQAALEAAAARDPPTPEERAASLAAVRAFELGWRYRHRMSTEM